MPSLLTRQITPAMILDAPVLLHRWLIAHIGTATLVYLLALTAMLGMYLVATPISSSDTDLWYHLNGGRLFWEFGQLPDSAFYSFFNDDGDRSWVNYFWGFQALSYLVHDLLGYPGLILLRLILAGTAFAAITALLIRPHDRPAQRAWALTLLALVMIVFVGRTGLIRPHLVSYAMIPLFILILQHHRRWLPVLPILTVAWVNLHGTEWPVGALICGAFALRALWEWRRSGKPLAGLDWQTVGWTLACLPATFVNPFGPAILTAPFNMSPEVYAYIGELRSYPLATLFTLNMTGPVIAVNGAIALLVWGTLFALGALLFRARLPLVPLLLWIGAVYLLFRGVRFAWEWLLLSLPLWRAAVDTLDGQRMDEGQVRPGVMQLLLALLMVAPLVSWANQLRQHVEWPVDTAKLPTGIAGFLADQGVHGRMLVPPTPSGYLSWRLYPAVLTSGDMASPPTLPWDHFRRNASVRNGASLARMIRRYDPGLIAVEKDIAVFDDLVLMHPEYQAVFFDDVLVLYADAKQYPTLVSEFAFEHVNPFNLNDPKSGTPAQRLTELRRVHATDPVGDRVQHAITRLLFDQGRYEEALAAARAFVESVPDNPNSHFLLGNSLENLDRFEEAERHYLDALEHAPQDFRPVLYRHLGACAYLRKDFARAVSYLEQGVNAYKEAVEPEAFFQYAVSAMAVGDTRKAITLSRQLLFALPLDEVEMRTRTEALLADLESGEI